MNGVQRSVSAVMIITVVSKCLGFLREIVLAYFFGASLVTDAYFVAQLIPEFLFSLVVQAVSIGFIPIYMEIRHKEGAGNAISFTNRLYGYGCFLAFVLVLGVYGFTDFVVKLFASGFEASALDMAKTFVRVSVWGMLFRIISAIDSAFLNANGKFAVPAMLGIPFDIITILSVFAAHFYKHPILLAFGITVSSLVQALMQLPVVLSVKRNAIRAGKKENIKPYIKKMMGLFLPVAIGVGANQINIVVDRTLASSFEGGISALNYANKVDNILENVIIMSLATVMFSTFSKDAAENNHKKLSKDIGSSLLVVVAIMIPCSIYAFQYAEVIIDFLFGRGAFGHHAFSMTASAMKYYSAGLFFISCNAILTRALYSLKRVKISSLCTCGSVVVNVCFNLLLAPILGIGGLALATSMANFALTILLATQLVKEIGTDFLAGIRKDTGKYLIAAVGLLIVSKVSFDVLIEAVSPVLTCMIAALTGGVLYCLILWLLKTESAAALAGGAVQQIFRKKK